VSPLAELGQERSLRGDVERLWQRWRRLSGMCGRAVHPHHLVERGEVGVLAALGTKVLDLVMPRQAAFDELELALAHVGDVDRVLILHPHDRGDISLGVELAPHGEDDPNEAESEQQGDDEQRTRNEIAVGLERAGDGVTERGGDGPEQEQQECGENRRGEQHDAREKRAGEARWWLRSHWSVLASVQRFATGIGVLELGSD
jgi:hypothetical protein